MSHFAGTVRMPYGTSELFDIAADVESYPQFMDGMRAARILRRDGNRLDVEMEMGLAGLSLRVRSWAVLDRPRRIDITSDDRIFRELRQSWVFEPVEGGTLVGFDSTIRFRSQMLDMIAGLAIRQSAQATVEAFRHRAEDLLRQRRPS